jgi:hypothetical protein
MYDFVRHKSDSRADSGWVLIRGQGNSRSLKASADGAVRDDNVKKRERNRRKANSRSLVGERRLARDDNVGLGGVIAGTACCAPTEAKPHTKRKKKRAGPSQRALGESLRDSRDGPGAAKDNCKNRFLAMLGMTGQGTGIEKSERYVPHLRRWGGYLRVPGMTT